MVKISFDVLTVLLFLVFSFLFYKKYFSTQQNLISQKLEKNSQIILENFQIDVYNASGVEGVGISMAQKYREIGIDVLDIKKFSNISEESFLIDRIGNKKKMKVLANAIGIDTTKIISQISKDYIWEASVIIGKDLLTQNSK